MTVATITEKPTDQTTLRDMLAPFFRRKRLAFVIFAGVLLGSLCASIFAAHFYEVTCQVIVDRERQDPMVTTEQTNQPSQPASSVTPEEINSEIEILKSPDLLQEVVLANNLQDREEHSLMAKVFPASHAEYVARAVRKLGKKLKIELVDKSNNISVTYRSTDPTLAYNVMKSLADLYMQKHLMVHRPSGTLDFFTAETEKYRQALADAEAKLAGFDSQSNIAAPDVEKTYLAQQVAQFEGLLNQSRQAVKSDEVRIKEIQRQMAATPARAATQQTTTPATILLQQLKSSLLASQLKKTNLLMKYDPSYPLVKEADEEIRETEAAIAQADSKQYLSSTTDRDPTFELLRQNLAQTQSDLAAQTASVKAIENGIADMHSKIVGLDQAALQQSDLQREARADESNYLLYLSKREQERTLDALDQKRIANVAIAVPPLYPFLPKFSPLLIFAIGICLAMLLSASAAFLADYLDTTLKTPDEVCKVLEIPVLGSVSRRSA
jgi:polysaccharide biosynthesis protein PslE